MILAKIFRNEALNSFFNIIEEYLLYEFHFLNQYVNEQIWVQCSDPQDHIHLDITVFFSIQIQPFLNPLSMKSFRSIKLIILIIVSVSLFPISKEFIEISFQHLIYRIDFLD